MVKKTWIGTQKWHDILFLHWPVPASVLREHIPSELNLDLFNGEAWIGFVFFKATGTRPRFTPPIPGLHSYLELNVRTYVTYKEKSGVYFLNLDTDSKLAVFLAKMSHFLPYRMADISFSKSNGIYRIESVKKQKAQESEILDLSYKINQGPIPRTHLEYWLTERYCLWTKPKKHLIRADIQHAPWRLHAIQNEVHHNTMAPFLNGYFQQSVLLAHYSAIKKVRVFPPVLEN